MQNSYTLLDGKKAAENIYKHLKSILNKNKALGKKRPHLFVILVGDNISSKTYVNAKVKACESIGIKSTVLKYQKKVTEIELLEKIKQLNLDSSVHGLLIQLPLPDHIDDYKVSISIDYRKDVDGFHPTNLGNLMLNKTTILPATPYGIIELLKFYNIKPQGKHCVIIGRSSIVGTPMSMILSRNSEWGNATITLLHSKSKNIRTITKQADILIVALGIPNFIDSSFVKKGAVVIDVGINSLEDKTKKRGYRLVGDVNFNDVAKHTSYITKVPGGVGPMTIAALLKNTVNITSLSSKNRLESIFSLSD